LVAGGLLFPCTLTLTLTSSFTLSFTLILPLTLSQRAIPPITVFPSFTTFIILFITLRLERRRNI
jgi:hypothetical protein